MTTEINGKYATTHVFTAPSPGTAEIKYPPEFKYLTPKEQRICKNILEGLRKGAQYPTVKGGFGDMENCDGIIESAVDSPALGRITKFIGCDFYFKGFPLHEVVHGMGVAKAVLSRLPRNIIVRSKFWLFALLIRYIFARRGIIHDIHVLFNTLIGYNVNFMQLKGINYRIYNPVTREMKRAGDETLKKMLDRKAKKNDYPPSKVYFDTLLLGNYVEHVKPREIWEMIANVAEFVYHFINYDNAYRFRLQDVVMEMKKENIKKNGIKEIRRLFDILISREKATVDNLQKKKYKVMKSMITAFFYLNGDFRRFIKQFLLELDLKKIEPDESDNYFMLRRNTYQFRGVPVEERLKEAEKIDHEKDHVRIQILQMENTKTKQIVLALKLVQNEITKAKFMKTLKNE